MKMSNVLVAVFLVGSTGFSVANAFEATCKVKFYSGSKKEVTKITPMILDDELDILDVPLAEFNTVEYNKRVAAFTVAVASDDECDKGAYCRTIVGWEKMERERGFAYANYAQKVGGGNDEFKVSCIVE